MTHSTPAELDDLEAKAKALNDANTCGADAQAWRAYDKATRAFRREFTPAKALSLITALREARELIEILKARDIGWSLDIDEAQHEIALLRAERDGMRARMGGCCSC